MQNNLAADDKGALYTVSMPGKHSQTHLIRKHRSYLFTDTLVYIIFHCSGPPNTYVDFSLIIKGLVNLQKHFQNSSLFELQY